MRGDCCGVIPLGLLLLTACSDPVAPEGTPEGTPVTWASISAYGGGFFDHSCGLTDTGAALCWGTGGNGMLGDGQRSYEAREPVRVAGGFRFEQISTGWTHTCALTPIGEAYCWGGTSIEESNDNTGPSTPVRAAREHEFLTISTSNFLSCGIVAGGTAYCWTSAASIPTPIPGGILFDMISLGSSYACGVARDETAYCWGRNNYGQLGDGTFTDTDTPVPVASDIRFTTVAAGSRHTCGIDAMGAAYCWGNNEWARLGTGSTRYDSRSRSVPQRVVGGHSFIAISLGSDHTCGLVDGGSAYCWGSIEFGQLGNGQGGSVGDQHSTPVAVAGDLAFVTLDAGGAHTCGVTIGAVAYCWGRNDNGQLGDGTPRMDPGPGGWQFQAVPVRVQNPPA